MIEDMGNVKLFELCETIRKLQKQRIISLLESRHRLLHLRALLERESIQPRYLPMDIGSSLNPELFIKKGLPHGHRYEKTEEQIKHHIAHDLRKICIKKKI